jgi:hypothetical protein
MIWQTLIIFIKRDSDTKNEEYDKVLQNHEENVLDNIIQSLLRHEIVSISQLVFSLFKKLNN